jgi:GT2 family glycosyltransferase
VGSARLAADSEFAIYAQDIESGQIAGRGIAEPDLNRPGHVRLYLPLSPTVFDGRPHAFTVRASDKEVVLGSLALIMPFSQTPEGAILEYARNGMTPSLAAAAGYRYEALSNAMARLTRNAPTSANDAVKRIAAIQHLQRAHDTLVRGHDPRRREFDPLVFPSVRSPKVSVVIPAHNKFHVTYHCLCSVLLAPNDASFEVILVDDGSTDETMQAGSLLNGVKVVRNEKALGFIKASNRGAAAARGDYVVMLNNDTEVTPHWLDELVWPFEHIQGVGLTGAKLLYPDGTLQEAGGIVWNTGNPWNYGRNGNARHPKYNYTRQVDYVSGACIMVRRTLWKRMKGFAQEYAPAYFEDTDLAFRLRAEGLKTVYTPLAQVIHFEGASGGTSVESGTKRFQEINRPKFKSRWKSGFVHLGDEAVNADLVKDRNIAARALLVDTQFPMPDKDAGSYAVLQEIKLLQALGFKCSLVPQNLAWMPKYVAEVQRMGVEALYAPYYTSLHQLLEERGQEFDVVYIYRYHVAQNCLHLIRQYAPKARIVLNNVDLHFLRELRAAIHRQDQEAKAKALHTRAEELAVMSKVDLVLAYTDVERTVITSHIADAAPVERVPWVVDIADNVPGFARRRDIAFLGSFAHGPNAEAVEWFAQHVMPLVANQIPGVKLRVYGSHMPQHLMKTLTKHKDVIIEGWVRDVRDVYNSCRVFVAPLQSGAGIKGKVIGALAHGVPTVMSAVAAEGIIVSDGMDGFIARAPAEWERAIAQAYSDARLWASMSKAALASARAQFGFENGIDRMRIAMSTIDLGPRSAAGRLTGRSQ